MSTKMEAFASTFLLCFLENKLLNYNTLHMINFSTTYP